MRSIAITISLALATTLAAQGPVSLSLQQALDLAAKQSYAVQASELEAEKSKAKVKEITAIGLPQINGEVQLQNFIDVPTQLIPNFFTPGQGPEFIAAQFGLPWNASAGATLSQLIFDGSYIIGLKATRAVAEQSQQELEKAAADARNQAAKAYFGVLSAEEGARLAGEGIERAELALQMFAYRVKKYIGAYTAVMNGLDILVFTGGIGENDIMTRERILSGLTSLGIEPDWDENNRVRGREGLISGKDSKVKVLVVPTNEALVIASETFRLMLSGGQ